MLFHFDSVSKNHVQIENQILDLNVQHRMCLKSYTFMQLQQWDLLQWPFSTCSGKGVSRSSTSSSAYVKIVFNECRRCSSLKFLEVPTSDERDMVTCIFTRAKFCKRKLKGWWLVNLQGLNAK